MNLRNSIFIFAVSFLGYCSSAVIDVSAPDLLNVDPKEPLELSSPVLTDVVGAAEAEVSKAILHSDVEPQVVQVVETVKQAIPEVISTNAEGSLIKITSPPLTTAIHSVVVPEGSAVESLLPAKILEVLPAEPLVDAVSKDEAIKEKEPLIDVVKKEVDVAEEAKKSVLVAEGISDSVSSGLEGVSAPVSALLVETKTPVESIVELEKETLLPEPLVAHLKDSPVTVGVPVSPSVTVSSSPDVVSILSSGSSSPSSDIKSVAYNSNQEKKLYPVDISKNIYRTDDGILVRLEIVDRNSLKPDEKVEWMKVAPLPYPPRSVIGAGFLKSSHTNAKFTPVPAVAQISPKTVRVSRKLRYFSPRARYALSQVGDQEYLAPVNPEAPTVGCPNGNGRCFWPFADCVYDIYGEYVCWY